MPDALDALGGVASVAFPWGSAVQGALGLGKLVFGSIQKHNAAKEASHLVQPQVVVNPMYGQNTSLAESDLGTGVSANTERIYGQQNDRSLANSIDSILKAGGDVNSISNLYDSSDEGRQKLALMGEQLRLNHVANVIGTRNRQSEEEEKAFTINKLYPYYNKLQQLNQQATQGGKNQWSGIDDISSGLMGGLNSVQEQMKLNNYFKDHNPPSLTPHTPETVGTGVNLNYGMAHDLPAPSMIPMSFGNNQSSYNPQAMIFSNQQNTQQPFAPPNWGVIN